MKILLFCEKLDEMIKTWSDELAVLRAEIARHDLPLWRRREVVEKYTVAVASIEALMKVRCLVESNDS